MITSEPLHMLVHIVGVIVTLAGLAVALLVIGAKLLEVGMRWARVYPLFIDFCFAEFDRRAEAKRKAGRR